VSGALLFVAVSSTLSAEHDATTAATNRPTKATVAATPASAAPAQTTEATQTKLPSSVADVMKLSRAKVSEDVVLSFVQNAGTAYSLSADDIVQMRKEGVSDRVISAMLDQHTKAVQTAQQSGAQAPAPVETSEASTAAPASEAEPAAAQPSAVEAPLTPSGSSADIAPYPAAPAPYYYPYYYGGPVIAFGFGYGGCYYGGHGIHGVGGIHGGHH